METFSLGVSFGDEINNISYMSQDSLVIYNVLLKHIHFAEGGVGVTLKLLMEWGVFLAQFDRWLKMKYFLLRTFFYTTYRYRVILKKLKIAKTLRDDFTPQKCFSAEKKIDTYTSRCALHNPKVSFRSEFPGWEPFLVSIILKAKKIKNQLFKFFD